MFVISNYIIDINDVSHVQRLDDGSVDLFLRNGNLINFTGEDAEAVWQYFSKNAVNLNEFAAMLKRQKERSNVIQMRDDIDEVFGGGLPNMMILTDRPTERAETIALDTFDKLMRVRDVKCETCGAEDKGLLHQLESRKWLICVSLTLCPKHRF